MGKNTYSKLKETKLVAIEPKAFLKISLHSTTHCYDCIHGLLLGSFDVEKQIIRVDDVFPVCHGALTMPIVETATAIVNVQSENKETNIVGWYTSPELLDDRNPGPTALRMVACLGETTKEMDPILLVLNNQVLSSIIKQDKKSTTDVIQAFGRDFGDQWISSVAVSSTSTDNTKCIESLRNLISRGTVLNDLLDHLNGSAPLSWDPNDLDKEILL